MAKWSLAWIREESGETFVGTTEGVIKVRSIRGKSSEAEKWCVEEFNKIKGTPWEPEPGRPGIQIGSRVRIPVESNPEIGEAVAAPDKEIIGRRMKIYAEDVRKYKMTPGCPGCTAINSGKRAINHSEACRERIIELMRADGHPRVLAEAQLHLEMMPDTATEAPTIGDEISGEKEGDDYAGTYSIGELGSIMYKMTADDSTILALENREQNRKVRNKRWDDDMQHMNKQLQKE